MTRNESSSTVGRRNFIKDSGLMIAGGAIAGAMAAGQAASANAGEPIRIAFVGCGRRGRALAEAVLKVGGDSVRLTGLADAFGSQTQAMYRSLKGRFPDAVDPNCIRSEGLRSFEKIMRSDADLVYLATPPVYRPDHFEAAVQSGKHVFLEKPLAADVAGIGRCVQLAEKAQREGLAVHVGFQRRHDPRYREVIDQIRRGAIGTPVFARVFCNVGSLRRPERVGKQDDLQFQIRHWNHFRWTGGDFLIEQHVSGLDVIRWALDGNPVLAQGQGGWTGHHAAGSEAPTTPSEESASGDVFDHHSIEFEFADGVHVLSQCRRVSKAWNHTGEHLHGTEGRADLSAGKIFAKDGSLLWQSEHSAAPAAATLAQQAAVLQSIRQGEAVSDVAEASQSCLFAMLGQAATETGKRVRWDRLVKDV
ncbi:Gfo/Idh/MocA family protein [Roseiconus nitratireducens]|nr:Gfo/Idh/MocA family oxidoreductase [Roseiconus nitratireducens]